MNQSFGKVAPASPLYQKPETVVCRASIVGTYYRNPREKDAMYRAKPGDEIVLIRDGKNQFDRNAVKCTIGPHNVGFLSQSDAKLYGKVMDKVGFGMVVAKLLNTDEKYPRIEFDLPAEAVEGVQRQNAKDDFL